MNQQEDTLENCNKVISDILQYNFQEFEKKVQEDLIQQSQNEQPQNTLYIIRRIWDDDIFNQVNQNLSKNFNKNREPILREVEKQDYFICKQFFSQENIDLFVGYFQNEKGLLYDYIFKIYYCSNLSDIQEEIYQIHKYNKNQNDQKFHVQISESIHILVMEKKTFLLLQNKSNNFWPFSFRYWNKEMFNTINEYKPFQDYKLQKHMKNCQNCVKNECNHILILRKFQSKQNQILSKLEEKGFFLCEYLNSGGEGIIFEGYRRQKSFYDDYAFKILFDADEESIQNEINIMKLFEQDANIIKFIDFFKIEDDHLKIYVLILEKCQCSLLDQLNFFAKNKQFTQKDLFQIIFELLDGLIQLRAYNIIHLDIKPQNILVSNSFNFNYVYTDFGLSCIKKEGQLINVLGGTPAFESPEQNKRDHNIDFKSDIFSLGITFQKVIQVYKKIHPNDQSIQNFEDIISQKMIQPKAIYRDDCLRIHELFLSNLIETKNQSDIFFYYFRKQQHIFDLYSFYKNKDIPFFLDVRLYFQLKLLYLLSIQINNESQVIKIVCPFRINDPISFQITLQPNSNNINIDSQYYIQDFLFYIVKISESFIETGNYQKSLQFCLESLKFAKQYQKRSTFQIQRLLACVGISYGALGKYQKQQEYLLQSLQMSKQLFKKIPHILANSLSLVGKSYLNLDDYTKALEYYIMSLEMIKQSKFKDNIIIGSNLSYIASCYVILGDTKMSLDYLFESLQIQQIFQENDPAISNSLNQIGFCYFKLGERKKAFEYYFKSLQNSKLKFKKNHNSIADTLNNIGTCFRNFGDPKIAMEYLMESFQISNKVITSSKDIADSLNNIGICYVDLCDYKKAIEYILQALQIYQKNKNILSIYKVLGNIVTTYLYLGDLKIANQYKLEKQKMLMEYNTLRRLY